MGFRHTSIESHPPRVSLDRLVSDHHRLQASNSDGGEFEIEMEMDRRECQQVIFSWLCQGLISYLGNTRMQPKGLIYDSLCGCKSFIVVIIYASGGAVCRIDAVDLGSDTLNPFRVHDQVKECPG